MPNPDERREAAIEAAASAIYRRGHELEPNRRSPVDERVLAEAAIAAYDAALGGEAESNGELSELLAVPRGLAALLRDPAVVIRQDAAVFDLIGRWQKARATAESVDFEELSRAALSERPEPRQVQPVNRASDERATPCRRCGHRRGKHGGVTPGGPGPCAECGCTGFEHTEPRTSLLDEPACKPYPEPRTITLTEGDAYSHPELDIPSGPRSKCCNATLRIDRSPDGTAYYTCEKCEQPSDPAEHLETGEREAKDWPKIGSRWRPNATETYQCRDDHGDSRTRIPHTHVRTLADDIEINEKAIDRFLQERVATAERNEAGLDVALQKASGERRALEAEVKRLREVVTELVRLYELKQTDPAAYEREADTKQAAWLNAKAALSASPNKGDAE